MISNYELEIIMSIDEIKRLNTKEKIILMNSIWESLDNSSDTVNSPAWHQEVLENRLSKIKDNSVKYISLEELKNR